jgi:short-subunit dehydrogenase
VARRRDENGASSPERGRDGQARQTPIGDARDPHLQVAERVAVVTGASSGLGAAIARALAARGWRCVLVARRENRLRALAAELRNAEVEVCDVGDAQAVERMAETVRGRHPAIQLLVNNAGVPGRRGFTSIDQAQLEEVIRVNYLGGVWCTRALLPALEAGVPSDIVNIVSVAGTVAFAPAGPYSASKHAQLAFSRSIAAELRPRGIRVHTVNPGFVETEGFPQRNLLASPIMRALVLEPDDIARHVLRVLDRDRRETFVPRIFRIAMFAQALLPGVVARLANRAGYRPTIRS